MRIGSLSSLVPLKISSSYHLQEILLFTFATGLLIVDTFNSWCLKIHIQNVDISVKLLYDHHDWTKDVQRITMDTPQTWDLWKDVML